MHTREIASPLAGGGGSIDAPEAAGCCRRHPECEGQNSGAEWWETITMCALVLLLGDCDGPCRCLSTHGERCGRREGEKLRAGTKAPYSKSKHERTFVLEQLLNEIDVSQNHAPAAIPLQAKVIHSLTVKFHVTSLTNACSLLS